MVTSLWLTTSSLPLVACCILWSASDIIIPWPNARLVSKRLECLFYMRPQIQGESMQGITGASLQNICSIFIHIYSASFNRIYFLVLLTRCHPGIGCCSYVPLFFIARSTRRQTEPGQSTLLLVPSYHCSAHQQCVHCTDLLWAHLRRNPWRCEGWLSLQWKALNYSKFILE